MRIHGRLLLGMLGLAVSVPSLAVAAPFGDDAATSAMVAGQPAAMVAGQPAAMVAGQPAAMVAGQPAAMVAGQPAAMVAGQPAAMVAGQPAARPQPARHTHHGLFGRRHCVECQRAYVKAHDGVDVPAPPPIETGAMLHNHARFHQEGSCTSCQGHAAVTGPIQLADEHAPGYAVVGGADAMASAGAPGYAVVNETPVAQDPAPIGISRSAMAAHGDPRMAAMRSRSGAGGSYDPSVMPTSIPAAPTPMQDSAHKSRYQIIAHALGVPHFGARRRAEEERERQKHASISYNESNSKVTELPASMVYGKEGH